MDNYCMLILIFQFNLVRRNMHNHSIFYFSKSTLINIQYSGPWETLRMRLINPHKMKTRCQNQLKIVGWTYFEVFYRTRHKKIQVMILFLTLVQCHFKASYSYESHKPVVWVFWFVTRRGSVRVNCFFFFFLRG